MNEIKTKKKIVFRHLISPDLFMFGWTDFEVLFEVFKWMAQTGYKYKGMRAALGGCGTCKDCIGSEISRFTENYQHELKERFEIILNSGLVSGGVYRWREEYNIDLLTSRILPIRYTGKDWIDNVDKRDAINDIFKLKGKRKFKKSPIQRAKAVFVNDVEFLVALKYIKKEPIYVYEFCLVYGEEPNDSSAWRWYISSEKNELFSVFCKRALKEIEEMTVKIEE